MITFFLYIKKGISLLINCELCNTGDCVLYLHLCIYPGHCVWGNIHTQEIVEEEINQM